jgi:PIN domain nuclease of toxin-antitoxin system
VTGLLLDTHALIWWSASSPRLSQAAHAAIAGADKVWVSAASVYEADYKARLGRLPVLPLPMMEIVRAEGFHVLPISGEDAAKAASFEFDHADPFDRIIAAQSCLHGLVVVTKDPLVAQLGASVLW